MISPFASKLDTNYCPLDEEVLEIQRLLVEPLSRLKGIDDKIAELQKTIGKLTQERDSVSTYVEAHKALISPLRRLPLDIIQEIFIACLPTHRNCVMSAVEGPVLLGRICSLWRTVSLSTPRLWARLHIAEPGRAQQAPIYQEKYAQRLAITKAWLERSGRCPLSISFDGSKIHPPGLSEPVNRFLGIVLSYASRWQHISVTASSSALDTVFTLTEHGVPMLKTLEMRENSRSPRSTQNVSFGLLRGLEIYSFALDASETSPLALPLRWQNLTSLRLIHRTRRNITGSISLLTSDVALRILSKCTCLRTCQFRLVDGYDSPALEESILELPCLSSLDITLIGPVIFSPGRLFSRPSNLSFPFLAVSPKLEQLELELQLFNKESLLHFLSVLPPTIQQLLLLGHLYNAGPFDDDALAALTPSPDNAAVSCPSLQELEVGSSLWLSDHAVLRFIKARMAVQPATLRRVTIQYQREKQFDIRPEIQAFLDSGLEVSTRYFEPSVSAFSPWRGVADPPPSHTPLS
ncbi:hypothetical protein C8F04DRAFT_1257025 [Mycena alexandri]|uniref:F-box domain-containing protein n=1 Tax=Mycena alexandri TaxID=1745969 RepID=A0AAD6X6N6_9AGAR|nr:hypothetical protein C8F04DRAFT_1257025 [Mycena alexandri]